MQTEFIALQGAPFTQLNEVEAKVKFNQTCSRRKCKKHEPQASVFYISRLFSNVRSVLSQCNTRIRFLYILLYDIDFTRQNNKIRFSIVF